MMGGMADQETPATSRSGLPGVARWLFLFQGFNAVSFMLALGAPLVLLSRYLGATEFQIGLITALTPLLVVLQLPAASLIDRIGCRRLMLAGWRLRSVFLLLIVPLPFLVGKAPPMLLVAGLIAAMFCFNAVRGFATAAWFPFLSHLVAEKARGRYLGAEQLVINSCAFLTLIGCGFFLGDSPGPARFSTLLLVASVAGIVGVSFLRHVPEHFPPPRARRLRRPGAFVTSLRIAWRHPPFRRTFRFVAVYTVAAFSFPAFLVLYQRDGLDWGEGIILKLQAVMTLGVLISAVTIGKWVDRLGSRPIMRIADLCVLFFILFWVYSAWKGWDPGYFAAGVAFFLWGMMNSGHAISQIRLILGCCPPRHLTYSLAIFQVLTSLAGAASPVAFGWLLGASQRALENGTQGYAVLFSLSFLLIAASQFLLGRVPDPRAVKTSRVLQLAYGWPMRFLSGVTPGRR